MPHESATTALKTLGFSASPFHDPFHGCLLAQADVPVGSLKYGVLIGLANAIVAWLDDAGNVHLHSY
jgi:hypothetical protein